MTSYVREHFMRLGSRIRPEGKSEDDPQGPVDFRPTRGPSLGGWPGISEWSIQEHIRERSFDVASRGLERPRTFRAGTGTRIHREARARARDPAEDLDRSSLSGKR